eukprot:SAG11_NODE_12711_length_689_cov_0.916949_1_plen_108_part_01
MVAAQVFLNFVPLGACIFVAFFGRMMSDLLRVVINFFVVLLPLLGSALQEQIDGTTEGLTPIAMLGVLWAFLSAFGVSYMGIKRPAVGRKLETIGVSFLIVMILNSYY